METKYTLLLAILFSVFLSLYGYFNPAYNWDIIGYVAGVNYSEGFRGDDLQTRTFEDIKKQVDPSTYNELVSATPYRTIVASDSTSLEQQMPFYTIRMAYLKAMNWVSDTFGFTLAKSTYVISSVFAGLCAFVLLLFFPATRKTFVILFPLIILFAGFGELASFSTPDSMASLLAVLSLYFYSRKWLAALAALTLLPFVRTDFILLAGLIALCAIYKKQFIRAALFLVLPFIAYSYVNRTNDNYGYLKILNFTLMNNDPHPATMAIETSLGPYLKIYAEGFSKFVGHRHFLIFLGYFFVWFKYMRNKKMQELNEQIFIVLSFVILHMLLFPAYYQRFFAWCAAVAGLQLCGWLYNIYFEHKEHKKLAS